jgi:glutaredoxin-related protein
VLQKVKYKKNKVNITEISLKELKSLIKFKDCNTVEDIKEFLNNLKENEIMHIKDNRK